MSTTETFRETPVFDGLLTEFEGAVPTVDIPSRAEAFLSEADLSEGWPHAEDFRLPRDTSVEELEDGDYGKEGEVFLAAKGPEDTAHFTPVFGDDE